MYAFDLCHVPNVTCISRLSIHDFPFGFLWYIIRLPKDNSSRDEFAKGQKNEHISIYWKHSFNLHVFLRESYHTMGKQKHDRYIENASTPSKCDKAVRSLMLIQIQIKCDLMGQWAIAQRRSSKKYKCCWNLSYLLDDKFLNNVIS